MIYAPFHDPADFGTFDIASTQVNKVFQFDWDTDVIAQPKIVAVFNNQAVKTYTVGDGLAISNANRRVTLTLSGTDFTAYVGSKVALQCSFFVVGDIELLISLNVVKSFL